MRKGLLLLLVAAALFNVAEPHQGPVFLQEPPAQVRFSNSTGVVLSCSGHGNPPPRLRWIDAVDQEITLVPGLRKVINNGSLFLQPFPGGMLRPEIHATTYYCLLSNVAGSILSRSIRVQAVLSFDYRVTVADAHALSGNVAVLRCEISESERDYLKVAGWSREDGHQNRAIIHSSGKYISADNGALYVSDVSSEDSKSLFYCQTVNQLTGERRFSSPGKIVITEPTGNVPPSISDTLQTLTGISGQSIDLLCPAQGYPPPTVRWFKESAGRMEEISHVSARPVLTLALLQPHDSGRYSCKARNILGEDQRDMVLRVVLPLSAAVRPQQQVVDAGAVATFNCSMSGGQCSDLSASWRKNGRPLLIDRRINVSPRGDSLVIRGVRRGDNGMYQCFVNCIEESAQGSGELVLGAVAPELISTFSERTLEPGPPVSLRCTVSGNPPPRVSWLLDGGELRPQGYALGSFLDATGSVVSHLNVTSMRVQHGGVYTCLARNLLGTAQHSAAINVYGSPSPRPPLNLTVVAATDVMLRCPVAGYPVTVSWSKANTGLPPGPYHVVLHNGTLLLRQVDGSRDAGSYSCTATSDMGLSAQGRIHLEVMKPPKIAQFQFPADLEEGMRAQVACSLVSGDLPITINWRKDGGPLPQDPAVQEQQLQFVSNLLFSDLAARHAGDYTCIASNAAAVANATATLTVKVAPSWEMEPRDTAVLFREATAIHCTARGYPTPSVLWLKPSGEPVDSMDSSIYALSNGTLLVRSASRDREGQYTCQASNGIGNDLSKSVFLRVNVPARFHNKAQTHSGMSGDTIILTCTAEGDSPLRITWHARHRLLSPLFPQVRERHTPMGLVSELHLQNVSRRDEGSFRCQATNEFGNDEAVIRLLIKEAPTTPKTPSISEIRSRSFGVSWSVDSGSSVIIQYKTYDSPLWSNLSVPSDAKSAKISMLTPGTTYLVRLIAINEVGASAPGLQIKTATLQEAPERAPTDLSAEGVGPDSLAVRWSTLDPEVSGVILGYVVSYAVEGIPNRESLWRRVAGPNRSLVVLRRLRVFTRYSVAVAAFNHIGLGPFSAMIYSSTLQGVPDKPPQDIHCSALSPQNLRIRWQPPPSSNQHGIIDGYKVAYASRGGPIAIKGTTNLETVLHGLSKATSFNVSVLAYTAAGDGVRSVPVTCFTLEDLPGPPLHVKALPMTSDSIVVSWTPPSEPNGVLLKYSVYIHAQRPGVQVNMETVPVDGELLYQARRLHENTRYEFWVSASTSVGEGRSSMKISQSAVAKIPARVTGWSRHYSVNVDGNLLLTCRSVGLPAPSIVWRGPGGGLLLPSQTRHHQFTKDGGLIISSARIRDAGNYTCQVENVYGRDEIVYDVSVISTPGQPTVKASPSGPNTIIVEWEVAADGGSPITGFVLSWRRASGNWIDVYIWDRTNYIFKDLLCGEAYQFVVSAVNDVGKGKTSNPVLVNTAGSASSVPTSDEFILSNTTSAVLLLEDWPDVGCPIQHYGVEITRKGQSGWRTISRAAMPFGEMEINSLSPGTWYILRITVVSDSGSQQHTLSFPTRAIDGSLPPNEMVQDAETADDSFYYSVMIIVPAISGVICTVAVVICICIFVKRCNDSGFKLENFPSNSSSCGKLDGHLGQLPPLPTEFKTHVRERKGSLVSGHDYEICPYATFNLADASQTNPSRDYSMQLRSFNQQDCFEAPEDELEMVRMRSSKSPPDGLSLEVSCISSQQTLPVRTASRIRAKRATEVKDTRPWSCPNRKYDSDSSERSTTPAQSPVEKHSQYSWKKTKKLSKDRYQRNLDERR